MSTTMIAFALSVVIGLLLAETRISVRHEAALRERGAVEPPGDVYRGLAIVYPLAFLLMGAEGLWRAVSRVDAPVGAMAPAWWVAGIGLMVASKALKYWAIANLKDRWTFKVLVLPGAPLVRTGPYRYVDHPNYIAVCGELSAMALMMSAWMTGPVMALAYAIALRTRLRVETRALAGSGPPQTRPK
jgi:methyltransferase